MLIESTAVMAVNLVAAVGEILQLSKALTRNTVETGSKR